jgi:multidrug resistance efflux pump
MADAPTTPASPAAAGIPAAPATTPPGQEPPRKTWLNALIFGAIALIGVLIVLYAWNLPPFRSTIQSTEDAMVRGELTIISPQLSGYVVEMDVQDFQTVRKGKLLLRLDDRIYQQRVEQAGAQLAAQLAALANDAQTRESARAKVVQNEAALANAIAQANKAAADLHRVEELAADGSLSARERDAARAAYAQSAAATEQARAALYIARQDVRAVGVNRGALEAAVANAQAALHLAEINLGYTRLVAPRDGQLGQLSVRVGAWVNAGAQVMALVPPTMWVIANMKETQMAHVRLGQPARFTVDALDNAELHGHVERISPATGSEFAVITPDNATGNFVKIAQRIPVRISIDPNQPLARRLRPGMSVVASIDTAAPGQGQAQ